MRIDPRRIAGAAGIALVWALVLAIGQWLDGDIDIAGLAGAFVAAGLVGYLGWPGLAEVWARRDRRDDGKRFLLMGLGIVVAGAVSVAVDVFAGDDAAKWSIAVWVASVATIVVLGVRQMRRARQP